MKVHDVLIGEKSVVVETENSSYRYEKSDEVVQLPINAPDEVVGGS